jgi:hypothetical protein
MNPISHRKIKVKLNLCVREVMTADVEILLHISFQPDVHFVDTTGVVSLYYGPELYKATHNTRQITAV